MSDGQIVFEVTADGKKAIADIKDITRAIEKETKNWDEAAKKSTSNIGESFASLFKTVSVGAAAVAAGKALLDFGKDAIAAASALEEVQNVVDVTFGSDSTRIDKWAKDAGTQFGLTETQAKQFTSTLGAMMKSSGVAGKEIANMSTDLAGLAADMASFYNLDFETAFQKIRSGISGETEPLKQLGINMSVANMEAFALSQGLTKAWDKMTQGEQTILRYQYLMKTTADAQGDFARTSDGYANSMRKLETNIEGIKTALGKTFIGVIADATGALNNFLQALMPDEKKRTVLDDFAEIDTKTEQKLEQTRKTAEEAKLLIAEIENLGEETSRTDKQQSLWLETCKRLVATIPGLSSIINTETGEIKGGTQAVKDYVKAWEDGQTKLAMMAAVEQKESALSSRFSDLPGLELDMAVANRRLRKNREQIDSLRKQYLLPADWDYNVLLDAGLIQGYNIPQEAINQYNNLVTKEWGLEEAANAATDAYNRQNSALEEAKAALEEYKQTIDEMPDAMKESADAAQEWSDELKAAATTVVDAANTAVRALADYAEKKYEAVDKTISGIVKSLDKVDYSTYKKVSESIDKIKVSMEGLKKGSDEWEKQHKELEKYNEQLVTTDSIYQNLQSQAQFLDDYLANLEKARSMGLSSELLSSLSDGTVESAQYLDALVNGQTGKTAGEIDALYQEIQGKRQKLTQELTDQQLTVDELYKSMTEEAKTAIEALDLSEEAGSNAGKTVKAVAENISAHVPEVKSAVDSLIAQLERLNGFGVNVNMSGFGGFGNSLLSSIPGIPQHETGLNYVPFDGYLASLHEGEGILTAEENRVWQAFKDGGNHAVDYEQMGGVMRDNIKPGGNVYLDGRIVGSVISEQQGRSFRQLQRSGWQG